jgi:hypothetical protein
MLANNPIHPLNELEHLPRSKLNGASFHAVGGLDGNSKIIFDMTMGLLHSCVFEQYSQILKLLVREKIYF